jgi:hypothetical protein
MLSAGPRVTKSEAYLKLKALYRWKQEEIQSLRTLEKEIRNNSSMSA